VDGNSASWVRLGWHASSGVQRGGANEAPGPGHLRQGGIQRVKLQKFKCCNQMIFSIVSLLIQYMLNGFSFSKLVLL